MLNLALIVIEFFGKVLDFFKAKDVEAQVDAEEKQLDAAVNAPRTDDAFAQRMRDADKVWNGH